MKVLVVNSSHWMSEIGARLAPDCDFAVIWYYDHQDKINKVSLRAFHDTLDVSEIAKQFGGGGHKKAAGFQISGELCVDDIFDLELEDEEIQPDPEVVEEIKADLENIAKKAHEAGVSIEGVTNSLELSSKEVLSGSGQT